METSAVGASAGMSNVLARISGIQAQLSMLSRPAGGTTVVTAAAPSIASTAGTSGGAGTIASGSAQPFAAALQSAVSAVPARATAPTPASATAPPAPRSSAPAEDGWARPVDGRVTSKFGMRTHPVTGVYKLHTGTDFAAPMGSPIGAASGGTVKSAGWQSGYGNTVVIDHGNGITTMYAHASELLVKPGQRVEPGDTVAKAGSTGLSTGPHLHFEVREDDKPVDPQPWLRRHGVQV
ncbi:M23 family metallopeptidase [Motilibacter aurantiacus]|uniref:M23 family metallopeptidase n=1 Tax=Motilibacter aurantiacus TaxID=2714955 RepID=UPI001E3FD9D1|nr:M23 family metallopeptidase [Motilibacter aurantiacus]